MKWKINTIKEPFDSMYNIITNEVKELFNCIYSIVTNILSGRNATILVYKNTEMNCVEVLICYAIPVKGFTTGTTCKYVFKNINIAQNILQPILKTLAENLAVNIVEWKKPLTGNYYNYNENSLFDSSEIIHTEKADGIQFIITQIKPQRPQIIKTQFPVMVHHQLLDSEQDVLVNIPIKNVDVIIPTCIDIHTNIQINLYSQNTTDIIYAERYSSDMRIDINTMTNRISIFDNGQIRLEDRIDLRSNGKCLSQTTIDINTPDYSSIKETLNNHDTRITRPIIVIVDLLNEITKIAINELKRYYNGTNTR